MVIQVYIAYLIQKSFASVLFNFKSDYLKCNLHS